MCVRECVFVYFMCALCGVGLCVNVCVCVCFSKCVSGLCVNVCVLVSVFWVFV